MVTVTDELMQRGMSKNGAWSRKQLDALGVGDTAWNKGWKRRLMGTTITTEQKNEFLALKDAHLKKKRRILEPVLF